MIIIIMLKLFFLWLKTLQPVFCIGCSFFNHHTSEKDVLMKFILLSQLSERNMSKSTV